MKLRKMITVLSAITLMLTSCGVSALKGGNTEVGSKGNSTNSTREGRFFKTSDEEDVEGETALHKETPAYPELEPIPYIPDTAAGFPSDGSFPCVGSEAGYYDEYGHYHYSADDLYSEMYNACMEHRDEIYLNGVFEDADFQKATKELWAINPDLFWMEDIRYQIFEDWTARLNLVLYDGIDLSKLPSIHDELLKKADEIIAMANELPTDYEKIKFVHDHIIENTEYDENMIDTYRNYAYGCLVEGKTACNGYSKAFQLVMKRMGYACGLVSGIAETKHSWNYLWFGDDYYWVDLTWDDPIAGEYAMVNHNFFMCSDDEMLEFRTLDEYNIFIPVCGHDTYNYEKMNGLYLDSYDFDRINSLMYACKDSHIDLRFTNKEAYEEALSSLYSKGKISKTCICDRKTQTYFSWFDDDRCISIEWWKE